MGKNTSISLSEHFDTFISTQVETGRYSSTSEVVRAGLRLLEEEEAKLHTLRRLLEEGEESEIVPYSMKELLNEIDQASD